MAVEEIVSIADHEAGFKDITVGHKSGRVENVRLHAPTRRVGRMLGHQIAATGDFWPVVAACRPTPLADPLPEPLPEPYGEAWINKLTGPSADRVEMVCAALAFGNDLVKKMMGLPDVVAAMQTHLTKPAAKSPSSAPVTE